MRFTIFDTVNLLSFFISSGGIHAGVGGHAQVVEDQARVSVELAHFLSDVFDSLGLNQSDGEAAQAGDVLRAVAGADAAAVLVVVPIEDVMTAVFDRPVATIDFEQAPGIGSGCGVGLLRIDYLWLIGNKKGDKSNYQNAYLANPREAGAYGGPAPHLGEAFRGRYPSE
jgi:hypothetical protein